ncbi:MAG: response regulator [Gammaproteobacteria bacterium]|nr:response regulator [Gammaproteobacteria bacterium]
MIDDNVFQWKIRADQLRTMARQIPGGVVGGTLAAWILAFLFRDTFQDNRVLYWVIAATFMHVVLFTTVFVLYRRVQPADHETDIWGFRFTLVSGIAAVVWGSIGVIFFLPDSHEYQLILAVFLCAYTAVMMINSVSYKPIFLVNLTPLLLPLMANVFWHAKDVQWNKNFELGLGLILLVYYLAILRGYAVLHRAMLETITLRFQTSYLAESLGQQKVIAEQANMAKSRFLAAASHDLRQPLHAQNLFVGTLRMQLQNSTYIDILEKLQLSMDIQSSMLNALLDISKLDAGVILPEIMDFPIDRLLAPLTVEYAPVVLEKNIELRIISSKQIVRSDPALLIRILKNLVDNAIRYTSTGAVMVVCRYRKNVLRIEVRDSGSGIPEEKQKIIFQEYYQLDNPERDRNKGLGLGLSIVERLARLLDHPIELRSKPGMGSTFAIDVPFGDQRRVAAVEIAEPGVRFGRPGNFLVMLIDDDLSVRVATQALLSAWGCRIQLAESSEDAIRLIQGSGEVPDAVIVDYRLRDNNSGVETLDHLCSVFNRDIPAVIITGDTEVEKLQDVQASGYPVLFKPVSAARLRATLHHLLQQDAVPGEDRTTITPPRN